MLIVIVFFPPRRQWMDYRCRLGSLGNSSTASGLTNEAVVIVQLQLQFRPSGLLFSFVHTKGNAYFIPYLFIPKCVLHSILIHPFLPSFYVSLSYFILAVPMRKCQGKHACMSFTFPIAILKCPCFFSTVQLHVHGVCSAIDLLSIVFSHYYTDVFCDRCVLWLLQFSFCTPVWYFFSVTDM